MFKILIASFLFITSLALSAASISGRVIFSPTSCIITGDDNGTIKANEGQKVDLQCDVKKSVAACAQLEAKAESYDVILNDKELLLLRSKSGNLFLLADIKNKSFTLASSHFLLEQGLLMTKHCSGKIK